MSEEAAAETADGKAKAGETHEFQAEVARLLNLMIRSVYSETEIFLRELISNAADACDRLRYEALTEADLVGDDSEFRIAITTDAAAKTLTIVDNGIGMNRDDLIANLGTIARSGTAAFVDQLSGDATKDVSLIGQFGVGFYSAFMVADKVDVVSRRAGDAEAWRWSSEGLGSYDVAPAEREGHGTTITLHVREAEEDYLAVPRLQHIVKTYSDHIGIPISLTEIKDGVADEQEAINAASALWTRQKSEISDEQYTEFYRHVSHAFDEPAFNVHYHAEGMMEYTVLLYVPGTRPFDLFDPARKPRVKLYVKRVFITDDVGDLLPGYLRFLRGVVDSEDLPLNISREMLQNNAVVARIRKAVTSRVIQELDKLATKDSEAFETVWENFGQVLKEGIYEDTEHREALLKLARFRSTHGDGWTSLADYVARMKPGQEAIYYLTAADEEAAKRSPHLEGFASRDIEVLLFSDAVDDFWLSVADTHDDKPLRSITRGASDLSKLGGDEKDESDAEAKSSDEDFASLLAAIKLHLGETVKDVRTTDRLTDSPVCLVADDDDLDVHMERILRQHEQLASATPRILELNPSHGLIQALETLAEKDGASDVMKDASLLLLDQARILEGETPADPSAFAGRLSQMLIKAVG